MKRADATAQTERERAAEARSYDGSRLALHAALLTHALREMQSQLAEMKSRVAALEARVRR